MKRHIFISVVYLIFLLLACFISGCARGQVDLIESGSITLEKNASGKIYIPWCDVYKENDGIIVKAVLRRRDSIGLAVKTNVHVTVLSPEGTVLDEAESSDIYVPRRAIGRYKSLNRFKIHFDEIPPQVSLVRINTCSNLHDNES